MDKRTTVITLLPKIMQLAKEKGAKSIALPYLGCGTGHLKQERVNEIYNAFFANEEQDIEVVVYYL